jgi:signal transduction histidine kinase
LQVARPSFLRSSVGPLLLGFLALAILFGWMSWFFHEQTMREATIRSSTKVEADLLDYLSILQDAETGQRGYLLTGDERYLEPFNQALTKLDSAFVDLTDAATTRSYLVPSLARLREIADRKVEELTTTVDRRKAGDVEGALNIVRSGAGRSLMDDARALIQTMLASEEGRLDALQAESARARDVLTIVIWGVLVFVLVLGGYAIMSAWRQTAGLIEARDELRVSNEELVAEGRRREQAEDQLRQSQKMEAIGQLTGGIAHDFNNMLAVIISGLSLIKRRMARGETNLNELIDAAIDGAHRASALTKRLLDFSRQQALVPEPVDANKLVSGMAELLRRTLGGDIQLETVLGGGLWPTHADPGQLENAILNIAVNARDAMPSGGRLTIETQNAHLDDRYAAEHTEVKPGQYVLVAVTDTGLGMPPEVIAKAFDPFFTTKEVGKGTGLGLSQVFGFTKQSGGHVKIYSEPGAGTTVKLYLPRFFGAKEPKAFLEPAGAPRIERGAGEVILVVEDEASVRKLTIEGLTELGYTVLEAETAAAALRVLDSNENVALLLTDVVMPDMNGRKLAEAALHRFPDLRVLYMTGYTRNAIVHNGVLDADVQLLSKPFTIETLALKVREALSLE